MIRPTRRPPCPGTPGRGLKGEEGKKKGRGGEARGKGGRARVPFSAKSWGYSAFQYILPDPTPKRIAARAASQRLPRPFGPRQRRPSGVERRKCAENGVSHTVSVRACMPGQRIFTSRTRVLVHSFFSTLSTRGSQGTPVRPPINVAGPNLQRTIPSVRSKTD